MLTPARSCEREISREVTWCVQPPDSTRFGVRSKEYQIGCGLPRSVKGGMFELGFALRSTVFSGPGSEELFPVRPASNSERVCAKALVAAKLAPAIAAKPMNARRLTTSCSVGTAALLCSVVVCLLFSMIVSLQTAGHLL